MKKLSTLISTILLCCGISFAESSSDYVPKSSECYRHGYSELTTMEKKMYDYMLQEFLKFESNSATYSDVIANRVYFDFAANGITFSSANDVTRMLTLLYRDVPELYIMYSPIYRYDYNLYQYFGRVPTFNTPQSYLSELKLCDDAYRSISDKITESMSDYEKALILHDGFIDWADYGGMSSGNSGNIKGSFIDKRAVCEGFSRAYLYLCQRVGLECIYISGSLKMSENPESWGNHAWNFIKIDGNWYLVDITTDGGFPGICGHSAFLKGQDYFNASYKMTMTDGSDENINQYTYKSLPTLSKTDYTTPTSVSEQTVKRSVVAIYNMLGQKQDAIKAGLNIVQYSDGTVEKIQITK